MKSAADEEGQDVFGRFDETTFRAEKCQFLREEEPRDFELHIVGELVEHELFADARVKLGPHGLLRVRENVPFHCSKGRVLQADDFGRADIGREDDVEAAQVQRFAAGHRHACGIEDLKKDIEHARMRFLDFVEKQRAGRGLVACQRECTAFADLATEEQGEAFLILVFRHLETAERVVAHKELGEGQGDLRFAYTGRTEKKEAAAWTTGFAQTKFAALEKRNDTRNDVILSADAAPQMLIQ